jgi:hypothetical protein
VPPFDWSAAEYAEPRVPEGRDDDPIVNVVGVAGALITGSETVVVADCTNELASVTLISNE